MTNFLSSHAPHNCALHYFGSLWALRGPKMAPYSFYRPFKVHKNQKTRVHQKFGRCNCGWDEGRTNLRGREIDLVEVIAILDHFRTGPRAISRQQIKLFPFSKKRQSHMIHLIFFHPSPPPPKLP